MKTASERAEDKRQEKLADIRQQVQDGSLVIREMTDVERRQYPVRSRPAQNRGRR